METFVQCYLVRVTLVPDWLGHTCLQTYFLSKSDEDAVRDSFVHAKTFVETKDCNVMKLEVFDCHLSTMQGGVNQGGIDRLLYDSENLADSIIQDNLADSIVKERPDFIG